MIILDEALLTTNSTALISFSAYARYKWTVLLRKL